jgi:EmrB/QacA subfamily drug resistance transporter
MKLDMAHSNTNRAPGNNPWLVLFSVALGLFMVVVDVSILNIALPTIAGKMHASLAEVEWTLIAYTLALTGLVPFFGRISDVLGRKRLFITGVLIFASASLLAAFSQSILWLIGARLVQAFGGALITSNVLAIITDTFPAGKRGVAMGVQAILISGGGAIGPTLGGFLVTNFGWEWVFIVNVPIGVIAAILATIILPPLQSNRSLEPIDWLGAGLLLSGAGTLLLGITKGPSWGWGSLIVIGLVIAGLIILGLFILREQKTRFPLVDLSLFRIREFAAGQTAGTFATIAMATVMLLFPFYWQGIRGYSAQSAGLLMLPFPATLMFVAPMSGRLSDKIGARGPATVGLGVVMLGLFLLSQVTADMAAWHVLWRLMVFGVGLGMFMAPNNNSVMSAAPAAKRGIASGLLGMFRYSGQSLGIAFGGTVFAAFATAGAFALQGLPSPAQMANVASDPTARAAINAAFINGLHAAALLAIPLAAIGMLLSLMRGRTSVSSPTVETTSDTVLTEAEVTNQLTPSRKSELPK